MDPNETTKPCSICGKELTKNFYTIAQWKKGSRKCKECNINPVSNQNIPIAPSSLATNIVWGQGRPAVEQAKPTIVQKIDLTDKKDIIEVENKPKLISFGENKEVVSELRLLDNRHFPIRTSEVKNARNIKLVANHFKISLKNFPDYFLHYDVTISMESKNGMKKDILKEKTTLPIIKQYSDMIKI